MNTQYKNKFVQIILLSIGIASFVYIASLFLLATNSLHASDAYGGGGGAGDDGDSTFGFTDSGTRYTGFQNDGTLVERTTRGGTTYETTYRSDGTSFSTAYSESGGSDSPAGTGGSAVSAGCQLFADQVNVRPGESINLSWEIDQIRLSGSRPTQSGVINSLYRTDFGVPTGRSFGNSISRSIGYGPTANPYGLFVNGVAASEADSLGAHAVTLTEDSTILLRSATNVISRRNDCEGGSCNDSDRITIFQFPVSCSIDIDVIDTPPSGSITGSDCLISAGDSQCDARASWVVQSPDNRTSNIFNTTTGVESHVGVLNGLGQPVSLDYGNNEIAVRLGSDVLDNTTLSASCAFGSNWDGSVCVATSVPTATLHGIGCTIAVGNSTCNSLLSWNTQGSGTDTIEVHNRTAGSLVSTDVAASNRLITLSYAGSGTNFELVSVPAGIISPVSTTLVTRCETGATWNGSICEAVASAPLSSFSVTGCAIPLGANSCTGLATWNTTNLGSAVPYLRNVVTGYRVDVAGSGIDVPITLQYRSDGTNTIMLGASPSGTLGLRYANPTVNCEAGTSWTGSVCGQSDIQILSVGLIGDMPTPDSSALYNDIEFGSTVAGLDDGVSTNYTMTFAGQTLSGVVSNSSGVITYAPPLRFDGVPYSPTPYVGVLEIDLNPDAIPEDLPSTPGDEDILGNSRSTAGIDALPPAPSVMELIPEREIIRSNSAVDLYWEVVTPWTGSCVITGPGVSESFPLTVIGSNTGTVTPSPNLTSTATYAMTCTEGTTGISFDATEVDIEVIPTTQEI